LTGANREDVTQLASLLQAIRRCAANAAARDNARRRRSFRPRYDVVEQTLAP